MLLLLNLATMPEMQLPVICVGAPLMPRWENSGAVLYSNKQRAWTVKRIANWEAAAKSLHTTSRELCRH